MGAMCGLPSARTVDNVPVRVPAVMKAFHTSSLIRPAVLTTRS